MNQQQTYRPPNSAGTPSGDDCDPNEALDSARKEAASIHAVAKAHMNKVKSADSATYLEQNRQRSGQ